MAIANSIKVYIDGGARGNPGPGAVGAVIKAENGHVLEQISRLIGQSTNNEAEYLALISALEYLFQYKQKLNLKEDSKITFFSDSALIVNQVKGLFKVKNSRLREFIYRIRELETQIPGKIYYTLIPREKNFEADALVNQALDNLRI